VGREITKLHEQFFRGTLSTAQAYFDHQPPRGEFTLVIAGKTETQERWDEATLRENIQQLRNQGRSSAQIADSLALQSGWLRRAIYRLIIQEED
jgi:16S rRNA (cytidine1402-2'-O)-methyltransferase